MRTKNLSGAEVILGCLALLLLVPGILALQAWVLKWAWGLLVVPVFGLMPITFWQAVAACFLLSVIGSAFKVRVSKSKS